jgi:O-methyltransferase involved in polyketide biosynthesis
MRSNTASATANWMALFRGLATLERAPLVADPFAEHFVSLPYRTLLSLSRRFSSLPPPSRG